MLKNSQYQENAGLYTLQGINIYIPPWEKENHLQNAIFGGYLSSLEGSFSGFLHPQKMEEREHPGGCCDQEHPQQNQRQMDHRLEGPLNDDQRYVLLGIQITA